MKHNLLLIAAITLALTNLNSLSAKDTYSNKFEFSQPTKCDKLYLNRVNMFKKWNAAAKDGGTVLLGDSITQTFPTKQVPAEWNLQARGIAGDGIGGWKYRGLLDRLDVSCNDLKPSKIFIKIGINDIPNLPNQRESEYIPESVKIKSYATLIERLKTANPNAQIYLSSVLPTTGKYAPRNERILTMNKKLAALAKKEGIEYVDLHSVFLSNGEMKKELTRDGIHLNSKGYKVWIEALEKIHEK